MNRLVTDIEQEEEQIPVPEMEETTVRRPATKMKKGFLSVISGGFLADEKAVSSLPFVFYIAFLGMLYIANGYFAHNRLKDLDSLDNSITELRTQYIIAEDKLMYLSKESELSKATDNMGLKESVIPPDKIMVYNTPAKKH
jgi:Bacteriodetes cell division protein (FtsL-like)